jgi:hypothetical protein
VTPAEIFPATDEGRHRRAVPRLWGESWYFDFAAADASVGGFVRLGLYPNLGVAWYWAALVGHGRRLVLVRDHELPPPPGRQLEVRGPGIWSAVTCETPLDHWSVGLEAFAVALDDPTEAYRGERGDVVGLGFDLEWEATGAPFGPLATVGVGYAQPCRVSGEILVADERLDFDGSGHRGHAWGVQDWWASPRCLASGVLAGGASFAAGREGAGPPWGYLAPGAGQPAQPVASPGVTIHASVDAAGLPVTAAVEVGDLSLAAGVVGPAPLLLEGPDGRRARLARALCAYRSRDGQHGAGWAEWLQPTEP